MSTEVLVAILAFAGTVVGSFGGVLTGQHLVKYRLEQLEKKVDKHNNVMERMIVCEKDIQHIKCDIGELKGELV